MAEHRNFTPLSDEEFLTYDKDAQKNPVFTPISDEEFITGRPSGAQDVVRYFGGSAEEESGGSWLTDPLVALGKGTVSLGTQIGDLAMLGASQVGNLFIQDDRDKLDLNADARASGYFTPEQWNESLHSMYSKETQEAIANIENAEGAWGKVGAIVSNPRGALAYVTESIPGMVPVFKGASIAGKAAAASAAAKQLVGKEAEKYISRRAAAGSFGAESGVTGLALSQQIGQENLANGREYGENQWYAIPGALASAAISLVNPMEARIMTRNLVTRAALREGKNVNLLERKGLKGMAARLGWDMAKEGLAEEGVQNVIEGVATNLAGGRPWHEDMGENYVEGALIGGMMGGMMHPLTGGRRGSVEDAINNQGEPPADQTAQPQQAIDPNKVGAATPGQTMTPANQTQVAQAVSQVPDPNQAAQTSPAQAVATAPGAPLTTEEKWNAQKKKLDEENRLKAEEAARIDQEERAKYGEDFLARHADTFHKQTKGLSEDEKTFVFNTYEAQGILGNVNAPSRNRVDEALRAYKYSNGDKAKAAERFRGWAREAENSGAKNAVETADYYDAMADILEGQDAKKNLEFKRQQREQAIQQAKDAEAKAQAEAQAQAQAQQTKEGKTEAVEIPSTQEPKTAPLEVTQLPTEQELATDWQKRTEKEYLDHINAQVDRLSKGGKITPEQAEAVYETWNKKGKVGKKAAFGNAIKKLRSIEFPPKPKEPAKPTRKTLTEESKLTWDSQGVLDKEARQTLGYTDAEAEQLQRIRALFLSGEVVPNHKQFERLNNLILSGDTKGAKEQAEFMLQRSDALKVNAFIKDDDSLDEDSVKEFKRLLDSQQYKQALELAFKPTDEGGLGLNREDALSVDPEEATRASGNSEASEEQKIAKDNGAEGEDQEAGDFKNSVQEAESENIGESGSALGKGGKEAKNGTEKAGKKMAAAHSARVIKEEKERSKENIKITKGSDLKEEITKTVEEKKGPVDFSAKLNNLPRKPSRSARTEREIQYRAKDPIPKTEYEAKQALSLFVEILDSLERAPTEKDWVDFMIVPEKTAERVKNETGLDIKGYTCTVVGQNLTHAEKRHGEGNESDSRQLPISRTDLIRLPTILSSPDTISFRTDGTIKGLTFSKEFTDGKNYFVEIVNDRYGKLITKTFWKKSVGHRASDVSEKTPAFTSKNDLGLFKPTKSVAEKLRKVIHLREDSAPRKFSRGEKLNESQKDKKQKEIKANLYDTWGYETTNQLLDSGKVVICASDEEFVNTVIADEMAAEPGLTEEKIRQELKEEDLLNGVEGLYDPHSKKVYLVAQNIKKNDAGAVLAHELAVHAVKDDPGFKELVEDLEGRIATLMVDGLKSKNPSERAFWMQIKKRLKDAGLLSEENQALDGRELLRQLDSFGKEELLAYFMTEYARKNGIPPQGRLQEMLQFFGKLRDHLMNFLGVNRLSKKGVADLLTNAARVIAEESASQTTQTTQTSNNLSGRKASKSKVNNIGGKYANPNAEEHARYAEQLRSEEPRDFRSELGRAEGQQRAAFFGRANKETVRKLDGRGRSSGGGLRVHVAWGPSEKLRQVYNLNGMATPDLLELDNSPRSAFDFRKAILDSKKDNPVAASVYAYSVPDYQKMKLFLTEDRKAGVAVKPNGDIVSVFNAKDSPNRGVSHMLMEVAIANGGRKLDCFATVLPDLYSGHGFRTITRQHWNDEYSPDGWNKEMFHKYNNGEPDVVYMVYDPSYYGAYNEADGSLETDYDEAVRKQEEAMRELNPEDDSPASPRHPSRAEKSSSDQTKKSKGSTKTDTEKELKKLEEQLEAERKQQEAQAEIDKMPGAESVEAVPETVLEKGVASWFNDLVEAQPDGSLLKTTGRPLATLISYVDKFAKYINASFLQFTDRLVRDAEKYLPSAKTWYKGVVDCAKLVNDTRSKGMAIGDMFFKLSKEQREQVNKFLYDSVMSDKWGYIPTDWLNSKGELIKEDAFTVSPELAKRFTKLSKEEQEVIRQVHKWGHDTQLRKQKLIDTLGTALQGDAYKSKFKDPETYLPYVPLERTGRYNVVWKSKALTDAEAKYNRLKKARDEWEALNQKEKAKAEEQKTEFKKLDFPDENAFEELKRQIDNMRRDGNHYHVARFDSLAKAQQRMNELNAQHGNKSAQLYDIGNKEHMKSLTSSREIEELASELKSSLNKTFYGKAYQGLLDVIDEYAYDAGRKTVDNSLRDRLKVAGANENIMDSFLNRVNSDAHLIANMTYGKTISDAYVKMKDELKEFRGKHGSASLVNSVTTTFNELEKRHLQMMERKPHTGFDTLSEGLRSANTHFSLTFKPMFYVQNALQPWMMTAPVLAGRFGMGPSHGALLEAYQNYGVIFGNAFSNAGSIAEKLKAFGNLTKQIENSKLLKTGEKNMLEEMERRNLLDLGAQQEFGSFIGDNAFSKAVNRVTTEIGVATRGVEIMNRFAAALSGYRLQKARLIKDGMTEAQAHEAAKEYAAELLSLTQGDYSAQNAPSAFNTRIGKLALQFRKFQAIQFNFFAHLMKGAVKNMSPEEKAIARKQLAIAMATHFAMAGFKGLPAVSALAAILGGMFGDEDEEPEDWFRKMCAENGIAKEFVDLILEGVPSLLGVNLSDSIGAGTMASIAPYTRKDFNKEGGMKELLINLAGAPISRILRIHDGWTQSNWETNSWRPLIEAGLPAGIPGIFKAAGILDATVDKRTGAKFLSDEDFGLTDRLLLAMGATPKVLEDMYRMRGQVRRTQEWGTQQSGEIKARFINTRRGNNWKEINEIYRDLEEINVKRREKGLPKIKRSDLHSAYKQRVKEEKSMQQYGGMKVPQSQRRLAERIYNMNH